MAKKQTTTVNPTVVAKIKRKGVHAKKKSSQLKTSKLYKKLYNGQG